MATDYERIYSITPEELHFTRKGEIIIRGQQVGTWSVSYPKKENAAKGFKGRGYVFTERFYSWGFPYRGSFSAYSRREMVESIIKFVSKQGIDMKKLKIEE